MSRKIFIFFILLIALLSGITFWFYQKNVYSKEILKLEILGPETAIVGQEISYQVKYKNNGNVRLEELKLYFEYPENFLSANGEERTSRDLEDLYPGQEEILTFKGRLFDKEGKVNTANVSMRYRPKNLTAFYESRSSFSIKIEAVPITFGFDFPSKTISDKELKISLNYFSNLEYPLSDLRIKIDYPPGFEFLSAKPGGLERNEWEVGILNRAEGGRIDVSGKLVGEVGSQKIFKAELGIWIRNRFILLKESSRGVAIIRPHLAISQMINGFPDYIASPGELLRYEIFFRNVGEEPFENLFLVSRLEGPFDFQSVNSEFGKVNPGDKSILWDWRDLPQLQFLASGEEGMVEFWINLKDQWQVDSAAQKNFVLKNKILLSQIREEFETKINSKFLVLQKGFFQNEVFENSGPIPPRVEEATTYTIFWHVKNYYNDIRDVKIRATLPPGTRLTGKIFPEQEKEKFTFDSVSREIVWEIGDLKSGTGILEPQRTLAFQVALVPSETQRGLVATIINEAVASGEDQFTNVILRATSSAVDTTLPDDQTITPEQGIVE